MLYQYMLWMKIFLDLESIVSYGLILGTRIECCGCRIGLLFATVILLLPVDVANYVQDLLYQPMIFTL